MSVMVEKEPSATTLDAVVVAQGSFGAGATAALRAVIDGMPDAGTLVVDLAEVDALDERGIGALLGAGHRLYEEGRSMVVRGASAAVATRLRAVGLHRWAALA